MESSAQLYYAQVQEVLADKVKLVITSDKLKGRQYTVDQPKVSGTNKLQLKDGDRIIVQVLHPQQNRDVVYITDYQRNTSLLVLTVLFLLIVVFVSKKKGILSLCAMVFSFLVLMKFIIPQIIAGSNPLFISLLGSIIILPSIFYLGHGINKKTHVALISSFITLAITGILAHLFIQYTHLTGYANEEAAFLKLTGSDIDVQSILLSGIVIGALGILDDITISQSAIIEKLSLTNTKATVKELYTHGMDVGRDHISSLVNTLVLIYAGSAFPLFLLFYSSKLPYSMVLNHEVITTEIVRTLVSSIGIILAVPLTTLLSAKTYGRS